MAYIPLRKAVEFLGLHPNTLRRYADEGKIKSIKNPAGQRLYDVESYVNGSSDRTTVICYCRVSSTKQRDDLDRQIAYMQSLYPDANKVRIIAKGGGRKPEISPKEGICLCLVYLRQKPIFEILGLLFDISKTKANDAFNYWVDILREILPASQIEEVESDSQKYQ
ncbi:MULTISPECIES: transposase family protein [unclassified Nodularia (in: cyanobacteria)]|uniref:transposase family protein n=1 Tax=unclassified Nodularia (in: cyanobacteria) TaxID=2656917 RepID=UPI0018813D95|nr:MULTISPECIES: transposase family protein [unclassified Nodularia (in: cyanobacteria)]MBE9200055.1 transposase family protein [Nodularia sp. LEGE 06071]MCC2691959.1 transposase family protein [Nodularia sp. LEGE 04288]